MAIYGEINYLSETQFDIRNKNITGFKGETAYCHELRQSGRNAFIIVQNKSTAEVFFI
jgi:hypothetical protein